MQNLVSFKKFVPEILVYTDGACSNNGKKNARASVGVFFGENDPRNFSRELAGKKTNNIAELSAIIIAYHILEEDIKQGINILICTDSQYAMRCCTTYGDKCEKNGWMKEIPNKTLVKRAYDLFKRKKNIKFKHIKAHTGLTDEYSIGNAGADKLANEAIGLNCPVRRVYLDVPYVKKDEVKKLGAKWDPKKKKWYIRSNNPNQEAIYEVLEV